MSDEMPQATLLSGQPGALNMPAPPAQRPILADHPDYAPDKVAHGVQETVRVQHPGATTEQRWAIEQGILADLGYTPR